MLEWTLFPWHSVHSILYNLYINCDISITAENQSETQTKPDVDQKTKDDLNWQDVCAICVAGVGVIHIVGGVIGLIINYTQK